jgi:hypothetical protein
LSLLLGSNYDTGKIFAELESKGKIRKTVTSDSKTFITLTEEGKKKCIENLDLLLILNKEFYSDPSLQMKYLYEDIEGKFTKGFGSHRHTGKEVIVENLINRISSWND